MNVLKPKASGGGRRLRNDLIFIAALVLLITLGALLFLFFKTEGATVSVTVDGRLLGEYSLDENARIPIHNGDGYNELVIENGQAFVEKASCPDGICSSHRPIQYGGESIICLPNRVVIEVHSAHESLPDSIS